MVMAQFRFHTRAPRNGIAQLDQFAFLRILTQLCAAQPVMASRTRDFSGSVDSAGILNDCL
jgi:hypothetical protein